MILEQDTAILETTLDIARGTCMMTSFNDFCFFHLYIWSDKDSNSMFMYIRSIYIDDLGNTWVWRAGGEGFHIYIMSCLYEEGSVKWIFLDIIVLPLG